MLLAPIATSGMSRDPSSGVTFACHAGFPNTWLGPPPVASLTGQFCCPGPGVNAGVALWFHAISKPGVAILLSTAGDGNGVYTGENWVPPTTVMFSLVACSSTL